METQPLPGGNLADNRGPGITRSCAAVVALSTISVLLRLGSRKVKKAPLNASDYTLLVGWLACIGMTTAFILDLHYGVGKHIQVVPPENLPKINKACTYHNSLDFFTNIPPKATYSGQIFYYLTLILVKISILLLYRSLFPSRGFAIATAIIGSLALSWAIASILVAIFSCTPVRAYWDPTVPHHCINSPDFVIGSAVPNIVTDAFILVLPVREVWRLQMSVRQKISILALFMTGGLVIVASCVRFAFLFTFSPLDFTYEFSNPTLWSAVEANVAVLSACLPTLRPLLQRISGGFHSLNSRYGYGNKARAIKTGDSDTNLTQKQRSGGGGGGGGGDDNDRNNSIRLSNVSKVRDDGDQERAEDGGREEV